MAKTDYERRVEAVARAEDAYDLQQHIAWTDSIKPQLDEEVSRLSKFLIAEALGTPIPGGLTREQIAGRCYGIQYVSSLFERILRSGKKALEELESTGVKVG